MSKPTTTKRIKEHSKIESTRSAERHEHVFRMILLNIRCRDDSGKRCLPVQEVANNGSSSPVEVWLVPQGVHGGRFRGMLSRALVDTAADEEDDDDEEEDEEEETTRFVQHLPIDEFYSYAVVMQRRGEGEETLLEDSTRFLARSSRGGGASRRINPSGGGGATTVFVDPTTVGRSPSLLATLPRWRQRLQKSIDVFEGCSWCRYEPHAAFVGKSYSLCTYPKLGADQKKKDDPQPTHQNKKSPGNNNSTTSTSTTTAAVVPDLRALLRLMSIDVSVGCLGTWSVESAGVDCTNCFTPAGSHQQHIPQLNFPPVLYELFQRHTMSSLVDAFFGTHQMNLLHAENSSDDDDTSLLKVFLLKYVAWRRVLALIGFAHVGTRHEVRVAQTMLCQPQEAVFEVCPESSGGETPSSASFAIFCAVAMTSALHRRPENMKFDPISAEILQQLGLKNQPAFDVNASSFAALEIDSSTKLDCAADGGNQSRSSAARNQHVPFVDILDRNHEHQKRQESINVEDAGNLGDDFLVVQAVVDPSWQDLPCLQPHALANNKCQFPCAYVIALSSSSGAKKGEEILNARQFVEDLTTDETLYASKCTSNPEKADPHARLYRPFCFTSCYTPTISSIGSTQFLIIITGIRGVEAIERMERFVDTMLANRVGMTNGRFFDWEANRWLSTANFKGIVFAPPRLAETNEDLDEEEGEEVFGSTPHVTAVLARGGPRAFFKLLKPTRATYPAKVRSANILPRDVPFLEAKHTTGSKFRSIRLRQIPILRPENQHDAANHLQLTAFVSQPSCGMEYDNLERPIPFDVDAIAWAFAHHSSSSSSRCGSSIHDVPTEVIADVMLPFLSLQDVLFGLCGISKRFNSAFSIVLQLFQQSVYTPLESFHSQMFSLRYAPRLRGSNTSNNRKPRLPFDVHFRRLHPLEYLRTRYTTLLPNRTTDPLPHMWCSDLLEKWNEMIEVEMIKHDRGSFQLNYPKWRFKGFDTCWISSNLIFLEGGADLRVITATVSSMSVLWSSFDVEPMDPVALTNSSAFVIAWKV